MLSNQNKGGNVLKLNNTHYRLRKYRILEELNKMPADECKRLKKEIPKMLGITRQTWYAWVNASRNSNTDISAIRIAQIAKILNVKSEDLINIPIIISKEKETNTDEKTHFKFSSGLVK